MNNGIDPDKRAGKQRIAAHIMRSRMNKGKPVSSQEANELVDEVFEAMYLALINGFSVCIANFGSLTPVKVAAHMVRDPRNGETREQPETLRVKWTMADRLRDVINGRSRVFTVKKVSPPTKGKRKADV